MDNYLKEQIEFKLEEIDRLFAEYEAIFNKIKSKEPDLYDKTILASVLHSFYNGVENIFGLIAKCIDKNLPNGEKSHQELLNQMVIKTKKRDSVITQELYIKLREYATFRHFYRHSYSFYLDYEKMRNLVEELNLVYNDFKKEIIEFIEK